MTTEAGGGVPQNLQWLRGRLVGEFARFRKGLGWSAIQADALLADMRAEGFELVPSDRMERLRKAARRDNVVSMPWHRFLEPGDLDRPGGG